VRNLLRALGRESIEPINYVAIAATIINQPLQGIAANTPALVTSDSQHIELPDHQR
jgi:hypothetical protein